MTDDEKSICRGLPDGDEPLTANKLNPWLRLYMSHQRRRIEDIHSNVDRLIAESHETRDQITKEVNATKDAQAQIRGAILAFKWIGLPVTALLLGGILYFVTAIFERIDEGMLPVTKERTEWLGKRVLDLDARLHRLESQRNSGQH